MEGKRRSLRAIAHHTEGGFSGRPGGPTRGLPGGVGSQISLPVHWRSRSVGPPPRNLTPVPSPIALPPAGRGGPIWSDGACRIFFYSATDSDNASYKHHGLSKVPLSRTAGGRWERGQG